MRSVPGGQVVRMGMASSFETNIRATIVGMKSGRRPVFI